MTTGNTAFDLLLGELSGAMPPQTLEQVRRVFAGWAGQRIDIPPRKAMLIRDAEDAARSALASGAATPAVRDRLVGMGLPRRTAYAVISRVSGASARG